MSNQNEPALPKTQRTLEELNEIVNAESIRLSSLIDQVEKLQLKQKAIGDETSLLRMELDELKANK